MAKNVLSLACFADWCRAQKGVFSAYSDDSAAHLYFRSLGLEYAPSHEIDGWGPFDPLLQWSFADKLEWLMQRASAYSCGALIPFQGIAHMADHHANH